MTVHTLVVRYDEGVSPTYSAATQVLGGRLVAVDYDGNRLEVCAELLEALETLAGSGALSDRQQAIAEKAIERATRA